MLRPTTLLAMLLVIPVAYAPPASGATLADDADALRILLQPRPAATPDTDSLPCDLLGHPAEARPRVSVPIASPAVRGGVFFSEWWISNQGRTAFEGDIVLRIPEHGIENRSALEYPLAPACYGGGEETMYAGLLFSLWLPVPDAWSGNFTVDVRLEDAQGRQVGEDSRVTHLVRETLCGPQPEGSLRGLVLTVGQKRVVRPYDPVSYSFTVCNDEALPYAVSVVLQDPATGRPIAHANAVVPALAHNGWMAAFEIQDPLVTQDVAPRVLLVWNDGLVQQFDGDAITFAPPARELVPALAA